MIDFACNGGLPPRPLAEPGDHISYDVRNREFGEWFTHCEMGTGGHGRVLKRHHAQARKRPGSG